MDGIILTKAEWNYIMQQLNRKVYVITKEDVRTLVK